MKKILLLLFILASSSATYAQTGDESLYYNNIEVYKDLQLSSAQAAQIKELKREVKKQFQAIGRDRTISGYEKGQRKRALALKHKSDIEKILTKNQVNVFENKYGKMSKNDGLKDIIGDTYEHKLEAIEKRYEAEKDAIEDNDNLSKSEKKARLESLKDIYKSQKESLKRERKSAKNAFS
ncbi:hypothetical protein IR083_22460 [Dysgonomonas sp. GY75]|uniref:hypothetical protein n=1 Tax=Dysgonomonas sp. GY75 TaxID=2780419 RepID=UPI001883A586|nr:hypothetical protein [Dysgonomonas sp. GY75]MBF0651583.1 hypothetical protein [Dysgonomonas sp. GY75]